MSNKKYRKIAAATLAALTASASGNLLSVSAASEVCAIPVVEQPPVTPTPLVKTIYKLEVPIDGAISAAVVGENDGTAATPSEPEYKQLLEKEGRHEDSLEMIDSLSDVIRNRWDEFKDYYPGEETVAVFDGTGGGGGTPSESTPKEGRLVEFKTTKEEDGNLVHIYVVHREEETITASEENVIANLIAKAIDFINPIEEVHAMEPIIVIPQGSTYSTQPHLPMRGELTFEQYVKQPGSSSYEKVYTESILNEEIVRSDDVINPLEKILGYKGAIDSVPGSSMDTLEIQFTLAQLLNGDSVENKKNGQMIDLGTASENWKTRTFEQFTRSYGIQFDESKQPIPSTNIGAEFNWDLADEVGTFKDYGEHRFHLDRTVLSHTDPYTSEALKESVQGEYLVDQTTGTLKLGNATLRAYYSREYTEYLREDTMEELLSPANFKAEKEDVEGWEWVETRENNGLYQHIYRELPAPITPTTTYKTREGQILEGPVDGLQEQKDFENYNCVEVIETPEGNREFIYEPVTPPTEEEPEEPVNPPVEEQPPVQPEPEQPEPEQPQPEQPEEPTKPEVPIAKTYFRGPDGDIETPVDGTTESKEIPGYTFINTEEDADGNTIHNYVKNKTRFIRQDDRTEISETVEDFVDEKEIANFIFVETENNPGERIHIYKLVITKFVDEDGEPVSPDEEGIVEKKDIPNFRFIETEETPEGQTHKYESVKTHFVDEAKQPLLDSKKGLIDSEVIEGFKVIETNELENGDREHVYAPIVNRFLGPDGEELSPPENGVIGVKEIPNMRFLRTEELPNGDKDHHYEHIQTHFVDLEGLKLTPSENGLLESREFENYKLVETREEDNGDRTHIYSKLVTNFIESKNGTEISPSEDGVVEKKEIDGYSFVETKRIGNNIYHIYNKKPVVVKEEPVVLSGEPEVIAEEPKATSVKPQVKTGNSSSMLSTLAIGILSIAAYIGLRKRED